MSIRRVSAAREESISSHYMTISFEKPCRKLSHKLITRLLIHLAERRPSVTIEVRHEILHIRHNLQRTRMCEYTILDALNCPTILAEIGPTNKRSCALLQARESSFSGVQLARDILNDTGW